MLKVSLIPFTEFQRVRQSKIDRHEKLSIFADMCRFNTLCAVKRAGSGHLGSSFSAMDLVVWLYLERMNNLTVGIDNPNRDVYFSSKGHDVPGLYAVFYALGILPKEKLLKLRRLGGLDGHPDVSIPGIEANTGSLGMGISKGRGIAWAKRHKKLDGRVYVLTGDGELQEGQNYEALMTTVNQKITKLTAIVDHNRLQSDELVADISDLGDMEAKFRSFGWHAARCDGHDFAAFEKVFAEFDKVADKPTILIAETIKGRGVSFMEHPAALKANNGLYRWHAGAPDDASLMAAQAELLERTNARLAKLGQKTLTVEDATPEVPKANSAATKEFVADVYGKALAEQGKRTPNLVVLDGDLTADCRLRAFKNAFPERFIQNGIAEQDMVSMAAGLAKMGMLPVVNTFASFLAARANEQIYNNATEKKKILYVSHFGGLIPAAPGKSHQSIRDVCLFNSLPDFVIFQPCNGVETEMGLDYLIHQAHSSGVLRLTIGPSPRTIELPSGYQLQEGCGATLMPGNQAILFAYGPVMLHEALVAAENLRARGFSLKVVNMPWLNRVNGRWLEDVVGAIQNIFVLEDHGPTGALGDRLLKTIAASETLKSRRFTQFAVEGYPACGSPTEVLAHHGLDGASLANRIQSAFGVRSTFAKAS